MNFPRGEQVEKGTRMGVNHSVSDIYIDKNNSQLSKEERRRRTVQGFVDGNSFKAVDSFSMYERIAKSFFSLTCTSEINSVI